MIPDVAATAIDEIDAGSRFFRICSSTPSSSSRYTSQTSAMLWSVKLVGPFDMGRMSRAETPAKSSTGRRFVC